MSVSLDDWCAAVKTYLAETFDGVAEVRDGPADSRWRDDLDMVAVWWPGWDALTRDVALATPTLTLRYFPHIGREPAAADPNSGAPIRRAADALLAAFPRTTQVPGFFTDNLACRLSSMRPNYDTAVWRVEATLIAYALSEAA